MDKGFKLPAHSSIRSLETNRSKNSGNTGRGVGSFFKQSPVGRSESECVADYSYDLETLELTIVFRLRGTYIYYGVQVYEVTAFGFTGSRGKYFNTMIRNKYAYQRVG